MATSYRFITAIDQVPAARWDSLCTSDYPFVCHRFLAALEQSGSCCAKTGWQPYHLLLEEHGELVAALPGYIKHHSYGEYVFDWAWADAYQRYGYDYYPKWVSAIPFTPCQGPRLLLAPGQNGAARYAEVAKLLVQQTQQLGLSGCHCLFPLADEAAHWQAQAYRLRLGCQFHWFNRNYQSFDDFLAQLNSRKRKTLRKERQQLQQQGIRFTWLTGAQITPEACAHFYRLYCHTYRKRSGHNGYLTQAFFQQLSTALAEISLLVQAQDADGKVIAAALFFYAGDTLYGRYWGCEEEYAFLHFETCYYQGIDFAIARGLARFDGGAQGEHKLARGFEPQLTYSAHWLHDERFAAAIGNFIDEEASEVRAYQQQAQGLLPYKEAGI